MANFETTPTTKRWIPRFSLLTVLLLMALSACGITIFRLWYEVGPLRVEVRELRNETGRLSIDDPSKPHVVQVRTNDEFTWKWRVWIPAGRAYRIQLAVQDIPKKGYPKTQGMILLDEPGEMWIEYRIAPSPGSENWMDKLTTSSGSVGSSSQPWVKWSRRTGIGEGVGHTTQVFEPATDILITRERVSQKAISSDQLEDPSAGFMIWLEPVK